VEKLRTLDPCALLTKDILATVGEPVDNHRNDFGECANYMTDSAGKSLSITLTIGQTVPNPRDADQNIGGLPALENELDSGDACFVTVVTSTEPDVGITIQAGGDSKDLCEAGHTVMAAVVDRVHSDPPTYSTPRGTLVELDPCEVVDDAALRTVLGDGVGDGEPYNLHWCNWHGSAANLGVWLRVGYDPTKTDVGKPVALGGGTTGYKRASTAASCEVQWAHRPFDGDDTEIAHVFYDKLKPVKGEDPCVPALKFAKSLNSTLPRA
jgi:hypothetical protein